VQHIVTDDHKKDVVRILANLSGETENFEVTEIQKGFSLSREEVCKQGKFRPRVTRHALSQLREEGLVRKSYVMINTPKGHSRHEHYSLNWDMTSEITTYIEFSPPPKRPVRTQ
jgi:hypothetical protein